MDCCGRMGIVIAMVSCLKLTQWTSVTVYSISVHTHNSLWFSANQEADKPWNMGCWLSEMHFWFSVRQAFVQTHLTIKTTSFNELD